jgi:ribosomal protein S18 acetylase RimI-like enzyme
MSIEYRIEPATIDDCDTIARAIAVSSAGYAQIGWQVEQARFPGLDLLAIGARLYAADIQPFTWRNAVIARGIESLGVMLCYGIDADYQSAEPEADEEDEADVYYPVRMEVPDSWYLCGMTVFERWRGHGIGSRLLETAQHQARQHGYSTISLISFEQNTGALRLYLRNGYEIVERRAVVPHPMIEYRGDALLMAANVP